MTLVPSREGIGVGDKVWPELGNGGYDVVDQQLAFRFEDKLTQYEASTTLTARATQALSQFDLDLLGPQVTDVRNTVPDVTKAGPPPGSSGRIARSPPN